MIILTDGNRRIRLTKNSRIGRVTLHTGSRQIRMQRTTKPVLMSLRTKARLSRKARVTVRFTTKTGIKRRLSSRIATTQKMPRTLTCTDAITMPTTTKITRRGKKGSRVSATVNAVLGGRLSIVLIDKRGHTVAMQRGTTIGTTKLRRARNVVVIPVRAGAHIRVTLNTARRAPKATRVRALLTTPEGPVYRAQK